MTASSHRTARPTRPAVPPLPQRSVSQVLAQCLEIARQQGMARLWFKVLGELGYRRMLLVERNLHEPICDRLTDLHVQYSELQPGEIPEYVDFAYRSELKVSYLKALFDMSPERFVEQRLLAGDRCFVARVMGQLATATWATISWTGIYYLRGEICLRPDEAYLYSTYTEPQFRGRNLVTALGMEIVQQYRAMGFRRLLSAIRVENRSSLRARSKGGFRVVGKIGFLGIRHWGYCFSWPERGRLRKLPNARQIASIT